MEGRPCLGLLPNDLAGEVEALLARLRRRPNVPNVPNVPEDKRAGYDEGASFVSDDEDDEVERKTLRRSNAMGSSDLYPLHLRYQAYPREVAKQLRNEALEASKRILAVAAEYEALSIERRQMSRDAEARARRSSHYSSANNSTSGMRRPAAKSSPGQDLWSDCHSTNSSVKLLKILGWDGSPMTGPVARMTT
jgi:hypothetical protein